MIFPSYNYYSVELVYMHMAYSMGIQWIGVATVFDSKHIEAIFLQISYAVASWTYSSQSEWYA